MTETRWSDVCLTALTPIIWGSTYFVTTQALPPDRPLTAAMLRALPIGLALLMIHRQWPSGRWVWRMLFLGGLNITVFQSLLFVAAYRLPGGVAATLGAIQPLLVAFLAVPILGLRPRARTVLAGLTGVIGVGLLVLTPAARLDGAGLAAALGGAVAMALGTVLSRRWLPPVPVMTFTAWQLTAGGILLLPIALLVEPEFPTLTPLNVLGYVYLGLFGAGISYALWFRGVGRLHPSALASLGLLSPVTASLIGWIALDQTLGTGQILGAVIVLAAVFVGQTSRPPAPSSR